LGSAFNHMADRIEQMVQRQQEFVANASHELRSPLAAIKLRAEALVDGSANGDRARQYAQDIDGETSRLGQLVSDLLALSRIDSRQTDHRHEPINVTIELGNAVRAIQPRLNAKQQRFTSSISSYMPPLCIDPQDLRLIVNNLLDNAVKYTPPGGEISLKAAWNAPDLMIEVRDTGEGIPPDDLPRVTERFFRVERSHTTAGTGLGLALVEGVSKQYDGEVQITSTGIPGEGTTVHVILRPSLEE
jgi:signal transduction histidine kinase